MIVQPSVDVKKGYGLRRVFAKFRRDTGIPEQLGQLCCEVCLVFEGEAVYSRCPSCPWTTEEASEAHTATCFYRSWNRFTYERTADVNSVIYTGVSLTDTEKPYHSVWSCDGSGAQSWNHGDRCRCPCWFSVMRHYTENTPFQQWTREKPETAISGRSAPWSSSTPVTI